MTISFECPHCGKHFDVEASWAGRIAKCTCGNALTVPANATQPTQNFVVRCHGCGQQHQANSSMAGQSARCACGTVLQIPQIQSPASAAPQFQQAPVHRPDPSDQLFDNLVASESYQPVITQSVQTTPFDFGAFIGKRWLFIPVAVVGIWALFVSLPSNFEVGIAVGGWGIIITLFGFAIPGEGKGKDMPDSTKRVAGMVGGMAGIGIMQLAKEFGIMRVMAVAYLVLGPVAFIVAQSMDAKKQDERSQSTHQENSQPIQTSGPRPGQAVYVMRYKSYNGTSSPSVAVHQAFRGISEIDLNGCSIDPVQRTILVAKQGERMNNIRAYEALRRHGFDITPNIISEGYWTPSP